MASRRPFRCVADVVKSIEGGSGPDAPLPLEPLLRRTARRDRAAFAALYAQTAAKLFGIALRIMRQRELAEEVLQESFVTVWERAGGLRPGAGLGDGLAHRRSCAIARSTSCAAAPPARKAAARPKRHCRLWCRRRAPTAAPNCRALQRCLDELEEAPRRAVLLAYCYGLTRDELAARARGADRNRQELAAAQPRTFEAVSRSMRYDRSANCASGSPPNTCSARCRAGRGGGSSG